MANEEGLEFRILGPLEARRDGEPIELGGPKQRALLALLVLRAGEVVSTDRLIDELWGEQPPAKATHTVQVFVSRLRKTLGADALLTRAPGYTVVGEVDVHLFRALVATARERRDAEDIQGAVRALTEALSLWHGTPLAEFTYEPFAAPHVERLEEERLAALEERVELELETGRHSELIGELEELCTRQPLRERPHAHLMLALYRAGRQSDALEVYRQLRGRLDDELALQPGTELQSLERRILQQDSTLQPVPVTGRRLPAGTVTFLFTDIAGSTRLLSELGAERYAAALAEHRRVLRDALAAHGGVEVDTQGDAFCVAFPTAHGAIAAAMDAQAALALPVRMGVHTGTPLLAEGGYVGEDVHRAARIAAAGHGRQVLVSASARALVADVDLRDLGEHRFKDLAASERVYQLGADEHPPLKSLYTTNFPVPATPFLGRTDDLAGVTGALRSNDVRLLTLTGPGGTGKTRLALQAAAEVAEEFPDGLTWIPLASLDDPAHVLPSVAGAVGLQPDDDRLLDDVLATALAGKRRLLLLDNAEHLLPAVADDLARLRDINGPTLLVTSRERVQLQGERVWAVPSLNRVDARELFIARAAWLGVSLQPSDMLDALCEHLDDLPLALELAAARTPLFTPEQLLARLEQRLDLRGGRDSDARQHTLRATIEWSHDLLGESERELFRRLSVFAGGCDYEAAESICGAEPDQLQSLLDKSLIRRRDGEIGPRYWMLETIREFAGERLAETAEQPVLRLRHARHYADSAVAQAQSLRSYEASAEAFVSAELSNLRAGLNTALTTGDAGVGARYLYCLWFYWLGAGLAREGVVAAHAWLGLDRPQDLSDHFAGLLAAGELLRASGDRPAAIQLKQAALELARSNPEIDIVGFPLSRWIAALLTDLAHLLVDIGDTAAARPLAEEGLEMRRKSGRPGGIAHALVALMHVADAEGAFDRAYDLAQEARMQYEAAGTDARETVGLLATLAEFELLLGEPHTAAATVSSALAGSREAHDYDNDAIVVRAAATLALAHGEPQRALRLYGSFDKLREDGATEVRTRMELERDVDWIAAATGMVGRRAATRATALGRATEPATALEEIGGWLAQLEDRRPRIA